MGAYPRIAGVGGGRSPAHTALPGSWVAAPQARRLRLPIPGLRLPQLSPSTRPTLLATGRVAGVLRWVLLVVATLFMGGVTIASLLGSRVMIVTSGSMVPTFRAGDAVVIRPGGAAAVRQGSVITFRVPGAKGMTTHRVVSIRVINGSRWFQTKGDANPTSDANLVPADAVYGKEILALPGLGRYLYLALTPRGKLALLGLPLSFLAAQEIGVLMRARRRRLAPPAADPQPDPIILSDPPQLQPEDPYVRVEAEVRAESARLAAAEAALAELERKLAVLQADNRHVQLSDGVPGTDRGLELALALSA